MRRSRHCANPAKLDTCCFAFKCNLEYYYMCRKWLCGPDSNRQLGIFSRRVMELKSRLELESSHLELLYLSYFNTARCITILRTTQVKIKQDSFGNSFFMSWTSKKTILIINYCLQLRVFKMVAQSGFEPLISSLWGWWVNQTSLPRNLRILTFSIISLHA